MIKTNSKIIKFLYILIIIFISYFILIPILSVVMYGMNSGDSSTALCVIGRNMKYLKNSFIISIPVTLISTSIGIVLAITLKRVSFKGRNILKILVLLPFVNPPFVGSISFIMLFGKRGLITHNLLGLSISPFGAHGIIFIKILGLSSLAYIFISSSINKLDITLEEAARNLGASEKIIFKSITLPLMFPEISSAALLVFLATMSDFSTPLIIGGDFQTLASDLYIQITGLYDMNTAATSGIFLLIPCLSAFIIHKYYLNKKTYFSDNSTSSDIEYKSVNKKTKYFLIIFCIIFISIIFIKYTFIIIGAFTKQWGYNYAFTLEHFTSLFHSNYKPFINSIKLATITSIIAPLLGVVLSYLIKYKDLFKSGIVDFVATLPAAVPGILFGIGYLVTFKYPILGIGKYIFTDSKPLLLLGTGLIIYIICIARFMNTGLRLGQALLEHISPDLEKASYNLGAGEIKTFCLVMIPLMKDAYFAAFLKTFSSTMVTLGAIIFLLLPKNKVAVQQIFQVITGSSAGKAASMSLLLSLLTLFLLGFFYIIFYRKKFIQLLKEGSIKWK